MKKGDIVKIFADPLTMNSFEGKAKLIKSRNRNVASYTNGHVEWWEVEFQDDYRIKTTRFIFVDHRKKQGE